MAQDHACRRCDRFRRRRRCLLLVAASSAVALPPGIVAGNGRIEADQIDIATKFAGRVAELLVDEGDMVKAGQIVARWTRGTSPRR